MEPRTFDIAGELHLDVRLRSGAVRITGTDEATATVSVTGERGPDEVAITCEASDELTRIDIEQHRGAWGFGRRDLLVEVALPEASRADIATGTGDLATHGVLRSLEFRSGSGEASIDRVAGHARTKTASGDVRIGTVEGDLTVTTASGDIEVGTVGGAFEARTASGDVTIDEAMGTARAMSASGDLSIRSAHGDLSLRSVSGDIDVGVSAGTRVWFDASSTSGDAVSELDPHDGGADDVAAFEIRAASVSGDIRIRRAATGVRSSI
ncbi:MAG: DUF4097 domain-containing protein [Actinomycetota bacterium]|nr:DUF4097 domain-containing protein [Actinomycetota bacterium]